MASQAMALGDEDVLSPSSARWGTILARGLQLVQLALATLVIRQFQLENRTFYQIFLLAAAAFPINAALPLRYRMSFFSAVSFAGIALAFGPRDGALLVLAGLVLIGICHLPISFTARIGLLLVMAVIYALARASVLPSVLPRAAWPILGSMFMFRLAVYLHALKHDPTPATPARTLAYFFMLPNVCYALYPVVDYATFGRTYYEGKSNEIYQRGIKWIARGLLHLLLYRLVYLHFSLDVTEVSTLTDLVQSLLAIFFLYLRVSGQFHLIVGVLHLFGFNLPETHRLYFLASSISDYWRRINIYWKDFMMKLVFYPSFFRLRKLSDRTALIGSTMLVFVATWILHSYQWFWLRSEFPITAQDLLFWGLLGGLVVINSLREAKKGRKRTLGTAKVKVWDLSLALRTLGTFTLLCALWSLWSTDSLVDWLMMWNAATNVGPRDVLIVGGILAFGLAVMGHVWDAPVAARTGRTPFLQRTDTQTVGLLGALLLMSVPGVQAVGTPRVAGIVRSLQSASLNSKDRALQQKGYYENLDNRGHLSMQLWNVVGARPKGLVPLSDSKAYRKLKKDFLGYDLQPGVEANVWGKMITINHLGMRDKEYVAEKAAGVRRIAMTGPSYTMGSGVGDGETYEAFLENDLNTGADSGHFEVMNFGVAAYSLLHQVRTLDDRVWQYQPEVVVVTDGRSPDRPIVSHIVKALADGTLGAYPELEAIVAKSGATTFPGKGGPPVPTSPLRAIARTVGVNSRMPEREATIRVNRVLPEIIDWSFQHMAAQAKAHGAVPVFVDGMFPVDTLVTETDMMKSARKAGFIVLTVSGIWEGQPRDELRLGSWDNHPNARAMKMIGDYLYAEFRKRDSELHLGIGQAATASPAH